MPYVPTPSGARYHYELYGGGDEKVLFVAGFACCKGYWKASVAHLLNRGRCHSTRMVVPSPLPSSASAPFLTPPSPSDPTSPLPPASPISLSPSPLHPPAHPNRYQICVFDTRGFGKTSVGGLTRFSTSTMAVDVLAILCHLGWVTPAPTSPYTPLTPPSSPSLSPPILHIVSWSLGGMICQELSFILLSPSSLLSHSLTSLVFTSSSPGGYRDPEEGRLTYLWRNQPPWVGFKTILRVIFSVTRRQRIGWLLRLHYGDDYLDREYEGVWPITDDDEAFTGGDVRERAAVKQMGEMERKEDKREDRRRRRKSRTGVDCSDGEDDEEGEVSPCRPPVSPTPSVGGRLRNRDVLLEVYGSRSPFDRNVLGYLWSLAHHVIAVYTHAFSRERFHLLHQYNTISGTSHTKTYTRTSTSITIPSTLPPIPLTSPTRRVHPLVLVGDRDELIAPQNSLTLAKYLRCPCLIFKGSGHMVYVEHATVFGDVLHKHFRMAREKVEGFEGGSGGGLKGWYEDDVIKVVDYTQGGQLGGRRLSTISSSLSSGREERGGEVSGVRVDGEGKGVWGVRRWRSLLTFFFVWKLLSSLPLLKGMKPARGWVGSLGEVLRPILMLYQHLRSLMWWRITTCMQWLQ